MARGTRLRVAQVIGKLNAAGVEAVVNNYCRRLDPARFQIDYFIDDNSAYPPNEEMVSRGCRYFTVPGPSKPLERVRALTALFRENGYDIVHAHTNALNMPVLLAAHRAGVPVRISHNHSMSDPEEGKRALAKALLRPTAAWFATHRAACGEAAGRWLFGDRAFDAGQVFLLPNAIDAARFRFDAGERARVREELGVGDALLIGHAGRFMGQKNHRFLIAAFARALRERPDAVLLLVGDGELRAEAERQASALGAGEAVRFLGVRRDMPAVYSAMDAFALPSLYEGLPVVGIEAQASGLPCLFSDHVSREADVVGGARFLPLDEAVWARELAALCPRESREAALPPEYDLEISGDRLAAFYERAAAEAAKGQK